jgi:hypothetical protein
VSNCAMGDSPAHTSEHDSTNSSEKSPMRQLSVSTCRWVCWIAVNAMLIVSSSESGQRSSSLFVMPPRPVFDALNHPVASARCKALRQGIEHPGVGLKAKLLEANALYDNDALPLTKFIQSCRSWSWGYFTSMEERRFGEGSAHGCLCWRRRAFTYLKIWGKRSQGFPQTMCWTLPPQPGLLIGLRMTSLSACPIPRSAMTVDSRSPSGTDRDTATSATTRRIINCPKPCLDS